MFIDIKFTVVGIKLNNIGIRDIKTRNLRKNVSYLSQDTHLFKGSIRDNLKIAKKDASEEELILACKKANIYDFIKTLEKGFDTEIVKENNELSTGQAQRLALARIFLRQSDLYLLDEPTANIDAMNEGIVLKSLYEERKDKSIIISSHRESSLRICNKIIDMKRDIDVIIYIQKLSKHTVGKLTCKDLKMTCRSDKLSKLKIP